MKKPSKISESNRAPYTWLKQCKDSDFDGHSAFASLTPSQRLEWLSQAGDLIRTLKGRAHPSTLS